MRVPQLASLLRRTAPARICPYCFVAIEDGLRAWRCRRSPPPAEAPSESAEHEGAATAATSSPEMRESYCDTLYRESNGPCPRCNGTTPRVPCCPHCKIILPIGWYERQALSIGVLGESGSGKTHYIVALHAWWQTRLNRFAMSFLPQMTLKQELRFHDIVGYVRSRQVLPPTFEEDDANVFLWDVHRSTRSWTDKPFYVFYHDTAGENLADLDRTRPRSGYVLASNMLLFLIDGARLRPVEVALHPEARFSDSNDAFPRTETGHREQAQQAADRRDDDDTRADVWGDTAPHPADEPPRSVNGSPHRATESPERSLQGVIKFLREQTDNNRRRLRVPIAVCLNKSDEVARVFPEFRAAINDRPRHDGFFDLRACQRLSDVVEHYLREKLEQGNLVEIIRSHFSDFMFFPTATLGSDVGRGGSPSEYYQWAPLGVEDPFLWILWKQGRIPALNE